MAEFEKAPAANADPRQTAAASLRQESGPSAAFGNSIPYRHPRARRAEDVRALQRTLGNYQVSRMLASNRVESGQKSGPIIGPPDDACEQEAQHAAAGIASSLPPDVPGSHSGDRLSEETRTFMEQRLGGDFGSVRLHTGPEAAELSRGLNAKAFAWGAHVYFGEGNSPSDYGLLAHELTHVTQQTGSIQRDPDTAANVSTLDTDVQSDDVQSDNAAGDPVPPATQSPSIDQVIAAAKNAVDLMQLVRETLFPAYRRAVDALDPLAAIELARNVVGSIDLAERLKHQVLLASPDNDYHRFLLSTPGQVDESEEVISGKFGQLEIFKAELFVNLPVFELDLAIKIGPQNFRDKPTLGDYEVPPIGKSIIDYLAGEAANVVELIAIVQQVRAILQPRPNVSSQLTPDAKDQITKLIEPWRGRPVNFAFLVCVLSEESIWQELTKDDDGDGIDKTLTDTNQEVKEQIGETGAFANVGELNTGALKDLLWGEKERPGDEDDDWDGSGHGIDDEGAKELFEKLGGAGPEARGPLIRQIDKLGMLGQFCDHLPWQSVRAMQNVIRPFDPHAAGLLGQHYEDKSDDKSLSRMELDQVDEYLSDEHQNYVGGIPVGKGPDYVGAFGWFFLDFASNALTGGFHHKYSEALDMRNQGWITNDQFQSTATKALGEAAVVLAASTVTGGIGGEFGAGLAEAFGASKSVAQIIGGAVGGVSSGLGGHFAGDVYEQAFEGKQGFDSASAYAKSGLMGGLTGTILAGVSVAGGRYLGNAERPIDEAAARNPGMSSALEQIRAAGFKSGSAIRGAGIRGASAVRMKVSTLLDMAQQKLFGNMGQFAFEGPSLAALGRLPPNSEVMVSVRPSPELTEPMQMSARSPGGGKAPNKSATPGLQRPAIEIEKVELVQPDPATQVSTLGEDELAGTAGAPDEVPQEVTENEAAQQRLVKNQQKQLRDAIDKAGQRGSARARAKAKAEAKGRMFNSQGAQAEGLASDTLRRIPGARVLKAQRIGRGEGAEIDNIVVKGDKKAFVESKLTIADTNQRTVNQLTNAARVAKPGEAVILHVARPPTAAELATLQTRLGAVAGRVQVFSDLTELYNAVKSSLD
jgi:Domain of unknown function (DUF4157)